MRVAAFVHSILPCVLLHAAILAGIARAASAEASSQGSAPSGVASPADDPRRRDAFEVESAERRAAMPERWVIPGAPVESLTVSLDSLHSGDPASATARISWTRSHGDDASSRYSALRAIDRSNVMDLRVAWTYRSKDRPGNIQCNPIVVGDRLIAPTSGDRVVGLRAATGEELWSFDPGARPAYRGLTYWPAGDRVFFGAGDFLWAIDPATGSPVEEFGSGVADSGGPAERGRVRVGPIAVAPAVFEDVVIAPGHWGDVHGFDARTGARRWKFRTVPARGEFGADTWGGLAPDVGIGFGANCWGGMALDAARGIAVVSTGSPKPNFDGTRYPGSNLFANCVLALDARTGARLWHFQEIRHDIWDLDIPAPPNLVTIEREGRRVDAVAQVTKIGNTLLLDRATGRPIFDVPMRRAPASPLPGERTWPYQPDIERPEPFTRRVFTEDDITTRSEDATYHVAGIVKGARTGWFEPFEEGRATILYGIHGGAEWTGAAFDPRTGRLYVSANELPWTISVFTPDERRRDPNAPPTRGQEVYSANCAKCHGEDRIGAGVAPPLQGLARRMDDAAVLELLASGRGSMPSNEDIPPDDRSALLDFLFLRDLPPPDPNAPTPPLPARPNYTSNGYPKLLDHEGYPGNKPPWGTLNCIDLNEGRVAWKVPLGEYPELAAQGLRGTGAENFGGATVTAGDLVFCAGTPDRKLRAFDADTGEELWAGELPWGGYAPPAVYEAEGRQFVVIAATGGGKLGGEVGDAWVAFALPER